MTFVRAESQKANTLPWKIMDRPPTSVTWLGGAMTVKLRLALTANRSGPVLCLTTKAMAGLNLVAPYRLCGREDTSALCALARIIDGITDIAMALALGVVIRDAYQGANVGG
jgi:hypothetical protein